MAEPLAAIRAAILDMTGEDYPLLGLLTDFEEAIRADALREAWNAVFDTEPPRRYKNDRNGNWWTTDMEYGWDEGNESARAAIDALSSGKEIS